MANKHVLELTDASFAEEVEQGKGLAIVDFWAEWCSPCRAVGPVIEKLAEEYAGKVKIGKLDVDSNRQTTERFNVRSIPSILYFKDGELVETVVGVRPKQQLEDLIQAHCA
jgi:thioredoxin 1